VTQADDDPRCPECGEPIGQTATYCMHCSADLTAELEAADSDDDGSWDESSGGSGGWSSGKSSDNSEYGTPSAIDTETADVKTGSTGGGFLASLGIDGLLESFSIGGSGGDDSGPTGGTGESGASQHVAGATSSEEVTTGSGVDTGASRAGTTGSGASTGTSDQILDPDGLVDNTLTVVVGILAGIFVGFVGTTVFLAVTGSIWGLLFGVVVWLGSTAHLVRQRTVQGAVSRGAYAVAIVLLLVPVVTLSPTLSADGVGDRLGGFLALLVFMAVPALVAAAVGFVAGRFVPDGPATEG